MGAHKNDIKTYNLNLRKKNIFSEGLFFHKRVLKTKSMGAQRTNLKTIKSNLKEIFFYERSLYLKLT